jgi:hypothetical protein
MVVAEAAGTEVVEAAEVEAEVVLEWAGAAWVAVVVVALLLFTAVEAAEVFK